MDLPTGSVNVELFNFDIANFSPTDEFLQVMEFDVLSGNAYDFVDLRLFQGGSDINQSNSGTFNVNGAGNLEINFATPLYFSTGGNTNFTVKVSVDDPTDQASISLDLDPRHFGLVGGNFMDGMVINTGSINLNAGGGNNQTLELKDHMSFVPPTSVAPGDVDVVVLEFELFGGANLELIDDLVFAVAGNVFDIIMAELYDIGGSPYLVASANTFDGDMDGVPAFIDEDDSNAGVYENGNLMMRGLGSPLLESYASSSNIYELKVSFSSNMMTGGNVEFSLDPYGILLAGGNMASGNFVSSGLIPVTGGGNGYDLNIMTTGFSLQSAFLQM